MSQGIPERFKCPCCGYPTLDERNTYEICVLCNWEDDGQEDPHANEVWGGPNADYSLTEARNYFKSFYIMYSEGRDLRLIKGQTEEEIKIKKALVEVFDEIVKIAGKSKMLWAEALRLESQLHKITHEKIKAFENNIKNYHDEGAEVNEQYNRRYSI